MSTSARRYFALSVSLLGACSDPAPAALDAPPDMSPDVAPTDAQSPPDVAMLVDLPTPTDLSRAETPPAPDAPAVDAPEPVDALAPDVFVAPDAPADVAMDAAVTLDATDAAAPDAPDAVVPPDAMDAAVAPDAMDAAALDAMDVGAPTDARDVPDATDAADARDAADVPDPPGTWRSTLFPRDWRPLQEGGGPASDGRFLHDFSYAGYHRGDAPPVGAGTVRRGVDAADFGAGRDDAAGAIQRALDETCAAGGGVVALSAGTFRLRFASTTATSALRIACSNVVLRGAGAELTRVFLDETVVRSKSVILVRPTAFAAYTGGTGRPELLLSRDVTLPTRTIPLAAITSLAPGDLVALRADLTDAFRAAHGMNAASTGDGDYWPASSTTGQLYFRRVVSVDAAALTVTLDAPTRYPLLVRDRARLYEPSGMLSEVGIEDLSIGMREHPVSAAGTLPGPLGDLADDTYDTVGTAAYDVHASSAVKFDGTIDGWISRVRTYAPTGNTSGAQVASIAMFLADTSARVTVSDCEFARPQYRGGGGNGYLFLVQGMDHLLHTDRAVQGRHNFIIASATCSGNVFLRMTTSNPRYADDSHRQLSHANLWDGLSLDRAWLQSVNRRSTSNGGGHTATQAVFWNTRSLATHPTTVSASAGFPTGVAIETAQYGWGYVIGTSAATGASSAVSTRSYTNTNWSMGDQGLPRDHVEGVGMGATLFPPSLYDAQRAMRAARGGM